MTPRRLTSSRNPALHDDDLPLNSNLKYRSCHSNRSLNTCCTPHSKCENIHRRMQMPRPNVDSRVSSKTDGHDKYLLEKYRRRIMIVTLKPESLRVSEPTPNGTQKVFTAWPCQPAESTGNLPAVIAYEDDGNMSW